MIADKILDKALKILTEPVCDHCLGRQFGQLLHGFSNDERGRMLRTLAAMSIDQEDYKGDIDLSNFHDHKFHRLEAKPGKRKKCSVCDDIFENLKKWTSKIRKSAKGYEFRTFLIGTKLPFSLLEKEEALWERVGIDYCEPLKAELNREIGKLVEKKLKVVFDTNPDITFLLDFSTGTVKKEITSLFIYGEYQKLVRGIPQTKWPSGKYKTSVEQIAAKPFMRVSRGSDHKFHGLGREDIDARCLGWRPFVLEITEPKKRYFDFRKAAKKIQRKIRVRKIRLSNIQEVRAIKERRADKTYIALVACKKVLEKKDLKKLRKLVGEIKQKTPQRVRHRRADRRRKRKVKSIKATFKSKKSFLLTVRGEAGLYIKELISGDEGRTEPSVSSMLENACKCKELDVVKIHS